MIKILRSSWLVLLGVVIGFALSYWIMKRYMYTLQLDTPAPPLALPLRPAPAERAAVEPVPAPAEEDDLTEINGIGPAYAQALNALHITTFAQLAASDPDELAARIDRLSAARIRSEDWTGQAAALSKRPA
ncbi:MAG: DUF4332 domain-containing protein [Anaerolineae bacterium]|nr:DUF4332 domain-containing protein [Anaerolineae bacterium]